MNPMPPACPPAAHRFAPAGRSTGGAPRRRHRRRGGGRHGLDPARGDELVKTRRGEDFADALAYVNAVGALAEEMDHHPDIDIRWNTVTLRLTTHSAGGLTRLDLELARRIDALSARVAERRAGPAPLRYVPAGLPRRPAPTSSWTAHRARARCARLSHWPGTPTPRELWHDVSAGIVLRRAGRARCRCPTASRSASIDHYDADGVIALALLCVEGLAAAHGALLVEAARVGDFDVVTDRRAALVAFALGALGDVERGAAALGVAVARRRRAPTARRGPPPRRWRSCPRWPTTPSRYRALWATRPAPSTRRASALSQGWATHRGAARSTTWPSSASTSPTPTRPGGVGGAPLHRAAVHSTTPCLRVATIAGGRRRGPLPLRVVGPARAAADPGPGSTSAPSPPSSPQAEEAGGRWVFDGAGAITGALHLARRSVEHARPRGRRRPGVRAPRAPRRRPAGLGPLRRRDAAGADTGRAARGRAQAMGRSHMGNHRDRSGSMGRSSASMPLRRSSSSLSRCSAPVGAKG